MPRAAAARTSRRVPRHDIPDPIPDHAWTRFRTIMRWLAFVATLATAAAVAALRVWAGPLPIHMLIATIAGVVGTVLLGGALMSLVFLSAGTGHDKRAANPFEEDR